MGQAEGIKSSKGCTSLHPNSISALKKFSALFHEENFFEETKLPLTSCAKHYFLTSKKDKKTIFITVTAIIIIKVII